MSTCISHQHGVWGMKGWVQSCWEPPTLNSSPRTSGPFRWEHAGKWHHVVFTFNALNSTLHYPARVSVCRTKTSPKSSSESFCTLSVYLVVFLTCFLSSPSLSFRYFLRCLLTLCLTSTTSWATGRTVRRITALRTGRWATKRSAEPTYLPYYYHGPTVHCSPWFSLLGPSLSSSLEPTALSRPALLILVCLRLVLLRCALGQGHLRSGPAQPRCSTKDAFCSL